MAGPESSSLDEPGGQDAEAVFRDLSVSAAYAEGYERGVGMTGQEVNFTAIGLTSVERRNDIRSYFADKGVTGFEYFTDEQIAHLLGYVKGAMPYFEQSDPPPEGSEER